MTRLLSQVKKHIAFLRYGLPVICGVLIIGMPSVARADCSAPEGIAGEQIYNSTHNVMQYCNGTNWIAMSGGGGSDTLSGLSCADGQVVKWSTGGSEWVCAADSTGAGGDNLGNHTATQNVVLGSNYLSGDGGNEGISVGSTGNVGIATTNPAAPLDIASAGIRINTSRVISSSDNTQNITLYGGTSGNGANIELYGASHASSANFAVIDSEQLLIRSVNGATSKVVVTASGNVGIGTASPGAELEVADMSSDNDVRINLRPSAAKIMQVGASTTQGFFDTKNAPFHFYTNGTSTPTVSILANGNVGIGTVSPSVKLHVVGSAKFTGALDMTSQKITNVADPTVAQDAATKAYVDANAGGGAPCTKTTGTITITGTYSDTLSATILGTGHGAFRSFAATNNPANNTGKYGIAADLTCNNGQWGIANFGNTLSDSISSFNLRFRNFYGLCESPVTLSDCSSTATGFTCSGSSIRKIMHVEGYCYNSGSFSYTITAAF